LRPWAGLAAFPTKNFLAGAFPFPAGLAFGPARFANAFFAAPPFPFAGFLPWIPFAIRSFPL
jgi:hypothetical protein